MALPPVSSLAFGLLALLLVVKKLALFIHNRKFASQHGCQPASSERNKDPILGFDRVRAMLKASKEHRFLDYSHNRFMQNGFTYEAFMLTRRVIHTADPKNLQVILATNAKDYSIGKRRMNSFRPLLGHGIFAADGKQWEKSRALLRPSFTRDNIADLDIFERHVANLVNCVPADGATVDLQDLFFRMTIDSATQFLFGHSVATLRSDSPAEAYQFSKNYHEAQDGMIRNARLGLLIHLHPAYKRSFNRAVAGSRGYVQQFVKQALRSRASQTKDDKLPDCFLSQLAELTTDETEITDQLLNVLLAGRDTTAGLLSIQFHILARRPDVWAKLKAEVATLEGRRPTFNELRDLKYVSATVNETLRLYPIIPRNVRTAIKDTVLPTGGGPDGTSPVFVAKGQNIGFDVFTLHRRHDIYGPDAEEFKPDRWENLRPGWAYLPFGGGPRKCIGQQFALIQAAYTTTRLVQQFERIESRDSRPLQELLTVTCASRYGTQAALFR
ncbi:hypothetical protein ASPWEDRAFT_160541 [Aspergillus wentii DTO 134E9]|uniref:Cytochrome P450 n=1 Tax=Aspergillus wentii DTO 134E9 TaxID=1073089 RepID=A0A1L9R791_ASPWE|nr:uncharacterized protein ASPWEDRAFT_186771 [Aspergillus wentii DTO 134E9]XP_040685376.1 uncharacterized protein ASPWEDRAFT_160541 [Aspergillus wentii DTO 134E9]OJJ30782.1 hypothetical protein ASPWEDRAFT_186771 [Aspergillus wentii DTO 134E9]OJJ31699.1 hypothetical protein ASPWEDRAFT_160541 [Aspergillus wentii DTO 134E9]